MSQEQVAAADLLQVEQEARNAAVKASGEFLRTVGVGAVAAPSDSTCYRCKGSFRYYALCSENSMEAVEEESAASSAESGRQEKDSGKKKTEARICVSCEVELRTEQWPSLPPNFKRMGCRGKKPKRVDIRVQLETKKKRQIVSRERYLKLMRICSTTVAAECCVNLLEWCRLDWVGDKNILQEELQKE